ncbi:response regulator [Nitrospirillum iridis]|uniref:DNA-binding NtrC family response regulator n=1 Tax=Nitrospirillum iridis TaxID=765888 RepID=A0A7X0AW05_9PROT|nr:response regulator [Nitrospirillum iridis]MBB6251105.1 DNA-binding NtrC family response regulator [Nitrospirillum iridis]
MVVDDNVLVGRFLAELLTGMGHDVCALEHTGAGAVAAATMHRPDLMIVDARLAEVGDRIGDTDRAGPVAHLFIRGDGSEIATQRPWFATTQRPFFETALIQEISGALKASLAGQGPGHFAE